MRDELEKLAIAGKIGSKHIEPLLTLAQGGYCAHKSWGFGRITTVDTAALWRAADERQRSLLDRESR